MHIPRQAANEGIPPDPVLGASLNGLVPSTATATVAPSQGSVPEKAKSTNAVAIALPIVLAVGIVLSLIYFYFKHKRPDILSRQPPLPISAPSTTAAPSTEVERERRREIREQRRLAALRRTESGRSVATLPAYKTDPGEEEQILLKRLETDTLSLAPTYDDTPWPEHPPTWSEIHGSSGHGRVSSPVQMSPVSPTSPSSFRPPRGARSAPASAVHSQQSHGHSTRSAPVYHPSPRRKSSDHHKYPARPGSAASSTWSVSTSSDEEGAEVQTSRARRIIGESSAKLLGNSSLRKHLQRNASFRLSPANSRMSSIRSVFTARTHQTQQAQHGHGLGHGHGGESTNALLPHAQETEEVLAEGRSGRSAPSRTASRTSSRTSLRDSVLGVVGIGPREPEERRGDVGRSVSQNERERERDSTRKKMTRKATA